MAEIFPDEGLDYIINAIFKGGTVDTTLFLGLFTSQTATTVPARTAVGGATPSGWTEAVGTGYARQAIATGDWGPNTTNGNGRKIVTSAAKAFPAAGAGGWGTVNGFFVATNSASGAGDTIIYFANFDDGLAEVINAGTTINVTPGAQMDG
jgi:hypothetical protein